MFGVYAYDTPFLSQGYFCGTAIKRYGQTSQYYPLNTYGALWTKAHPGVEVDLFQTYMERAIATDDRELVLHIIDMFGELRYPLHDYRVALRVLSPYVHEPDPTIRDHMVRSLGSLRGPYPSPVEHFLLESEAPRDLVNDIRSYSYQKPSHELYMRFWSFWGDLFAHGPVEFIRGVINMLDAALQARSLEQMAAIIVNQLLDTLTES